MICQNPAIFETEAHVSKFQQHLQQLRVLEKTTKPIHESEKNRTSPPTQQTTPRMPNSTEISPQVPMRTAQANLQIRINQDYPPSGMDRRLAHDHHLLFCRMGELFTCIHHDPDWTLCVQDESKRGGYIPTKYVTLLSNDGTTPREKDRVMESPEGGWLKSLRRRRGDSNDFEESLTIDAVEEESTKESDLMPSSMPQVVVQSSGNPPESTTAISKTASQNQGLGSRIEQPIRTCLHGYRLYSNRLDDSERKALHEVFQDDRLFDHYLTLAQACLRFPPLLYDRHFLRRQGVPTGHAIMLCTIVNRVVEQGGEDQLRSALAMELEPSLTLGDHYIQRFESSFISLTQCFTDPAKLDWMKDEIPEEHIVKIVKAAKSLNS